LEVRIVEAESKLRKAEQLATEAEQDRSALLLALKTLRPSESAAASLSPPSAATPSGVDAGARVYATKNAEGDATAQEKQIQLAQERAYSQELAKLRKAAATRRAEFEGSLLGLDPVAKFERRLEIAATYAAEAEFQTAIRIYNEAIAEKPEDLALPESARQLTAILREQNTPVRVTLISDGTTFVSVKNFKWLNQFVENLVEILPGNYEVVGRRPGYRDVVVPMQVRVGTSPPVVTVICTDPREK